LYTQKSRCSNQTLIKVNSTEESFPQPRRRKRKREDDAIPKRGKGIKISLNKDDKSFVGTPLIQYLDEIKHSSRIADKVKVTKKADQSSSQKQTNKRKIDDLSVVDQNGFLC